MQTKDEVVVGMKILVTGSNGGIGRWLTKQLLEAGHSLITTDLQAQKPEEGREHFPGDITDLSLVRRLVQGVDAVVHLAAIAYDVPGRDDLVLETNIRGTWNVLLACAEAEVRRVVYFSSINALGQAESLHNGLYLPLDDEIPHFVTRSYFLSKHIGEELCEAFALRGGMTVVSLRPTAVWHPGSSRDHWWNWLPPGQKEQIARNDFFSYVDVRDVCEAVLLSLVAPISGHEAFLLTADDTTSDRPSEELVEAYYASLPWPKISREDYFNGQPYRSLVDCSKAKRLLGWSPRFSRRDPAAGYLKENHG